MAFQPLPEHEVWVAHVGFVRWERARRVAADEYLTGAPDLVVEVPSPGNTFDEINDKMSVCLANGCLSFWVVDPKRERVSVTEGDVTRHYGVESSATSELIGVSVPVREIFTPDSEPAL